MSGLPRSAFVRAADFPTTSGSVFINGRSYAVVERSGYFKALLNGYFGWTSVWAQTYPDLIVRIKQVRSGGQ
jgi:hypothetical protein